MTSEPPPSAAEPPSSRRPWSGWGHDRRSALADCATAAAISTVAAIAFLELLKADLHVPFDYGGDALLYSFIVKSTVDHGWFWNNPSVGAPSGFQLYDFPCSAHDSFHLLLIRAMALFCKDWALALNVYFLLGFPLIAISATAVFRHFRIGGGPAIVGAVLYSFLPSRLLKGEGHLFMDVFYQVPLAVLMILWVCEAHPPIVRDGLSGGRIAFEFRRRRSWGSLLICALCASTSLYYAFFAGCLTAVAGVWASAARRSLRNAMSGAALSAVIVVGLAANALPTILYQRSHGANAAVAGRQPWEAEAFGMKITQLLLPVEGHRLRPLRELKRRYERTEPLPGEGSPTSLGLVGDFGFLALLGALVSARRKETIDHIDHPMQPLAVLNLSAILLGTIAGFGSLFALLISPQIRTYARINVLIGFFALFAVVLLLDRVNRSRPRLGVAVLCLVLTGGLFDQVTPMAVRDYAAIEREYRSDADLVRRIETTLGPGANVFELPYMGFPEVPRIQRMSGYDPVRFYLHSRTLRWSYPTMRGRPADGWARDVSQEQPDRMVKTLFSAGFGGILIDRFGVGDETCGFEAGFRSALGEEPIISENGRAAFFPLSQCAGGMCDSCGGSGEPCCAGARCRTGACDHGRCDCGRLPSGNVLESGQAIVSCDGRFSLTMQPDGDISLRGCGCSGRGGECWSSGSRADGPSRLVMRSDGNLVVEGTDPARGSGPLWSSRSAGNPGASLLLQNDGNVCVYADGCSGTNGTCWCSNSCCH